MNRQRNITNAVLWSAAMIACTACDAPPFVCQILLPCLAAMSLTAGRRSACFARSGTP